MSDEPTQEKEKKSKTLSGIFLMLGGLTVVLLGWFAVKHVWRPLVAPPLPPAKHVAVELLGREEYTFTSDSETFIGLTRGQEQFNQTVKMHDSFAVRQLSKDEFGSLFRFQLDNFTLKQTGRIVSRMDPTIEQISSSVNETQLYEEEYPEYLSKVLEGHSFLTRLGHAGEILERFPTNVVATMKHAVDIYIDEVLKKQPTLDRARMTSLKRELHTDLLEIGQEVVEEVQEAAFPYLQASPSGVIAVGNVWQRSSAEGLIPLTVIYKLQQIYSGSSRPVVTGVRAVSYSTRQVEKQNESLRDTSWLVISVAAHEDITYPLPPFPTPPTSRPTVTPTPSRRSRVEAEVIMEPETLPSKTFLVLEYLDAMVPPQIRAGREFYMAGIKAQLEGMLVVGASTGVVLDGWTVLTTNAFIELYDHEQFMVSTRGTNRIRGQVQIKNTTDAT